MVDPLDAVSPLDGRYAALTAPLRPYVGEAALARERVHVEVTYLCLLAETEGVPLQLAEETRREILAIPERFDTEDAERIQRIEREGIDERGPTHHDVKAVEYYLQERVPDAAVPWIHFGLTSADVNNLARRRLLRQALQEVLLPALREVREELASMAREYRDTAMPARTHGQPASPTTFGKECAVFATRLGRTLGSVQRSLDGLQGKCSGATGTYAAHMAGLPSVEWRSVCRKFVRELGLEPVEPTTQVNPGDDLAATFDAIGRVSGVGIDCSRDFWQYTADGYLQQATTDAVGSSTMPQKVNPIDFENAEGNLAKARTDLDFLSGYVTTSRLQRDLSDSTVKRTIGSTLGHVLVAARKLQSGLEDVEPDTDRMQTELAAHPEVLAEAVQSALRAAGHGDAYERVKDATRGQSVTIDTLRELLEDTKVEPEVRDRLLELTPAEYTGQAASLADLVDDE